MPDPDIPITWHVVAPSRWPAPPHWMAFYNLLEIEACPRRWALRSAHYPSLWAGDGYPQLPALPAIEGIIVHAAIDRITKALADRACQSIRDASAIEAMKELGGYTVLISELTNNALAHYHQNPRARAVLDGLRRKLVSRASELRSRIQRQVSRLDPGARRAKLTRGPRKTGTESRFPLTEGSYPEIELRSTDLRWHGVVDLLTVAPGCCEIRDFKTGAAKDQDQVQVRIYALLWARDNELNPGSRLVDTLVLSYDDRQLEVAAPSAADLTSLESELKARTATALSALSSGSPKANPSAENCAYCPVRHLCDPYWNWLASDERPPLDPTSPFGDIEITITRRHGSTSWDATAGTPPNLRPGLLRSANPSFQLRPGQRIRVLNAHITTPQPANVDGPEQPSVVTVGETAEMFLRSE
jgi:PD-(D/E)XK nuclease superfamily